MGSLPVIGSPLDGHWEKTWSCKGSTGIFAKRCAQGDQDSFYLDLWSSGKAICGLHLATGQLGLRVDDSDDEDHPSIKGNVKGATATVKFESSWGATGTASIRVVGRKLYWKILHQTNDQSWIPDQAVLLKQPGSSKKEALKCPK
jgi:hypothetical protein